MKQQILLVELHNLRVQLLESRIDFLKKKFVPLLDKLAEEPDFIDDEWRDDVQNLPGEIIGEKLFNYISEFDPDRTKSNLQWLLMLITSKREKFEDLTDETRELLNVFARVKRHLPVPQRDIMKYKWQGELYRVLQPFENNVPVSQRQIDRMQEEEMYKQAKVLLNDNAYRILIPLTKEASQYFGVNTRWCTAGRSTNYFESYSAKGPLYIILDKANNRRWQFHFESGQFMDEADTPINIDAFIKEHPEIAHFFEAMDHSKEPLDSKIDSYMALLEEKPDGYIQLTLQSGIGLRRRGKTATIIAGPDRIIKDSTLSRILEETQWPKYRFIAKDLIALLTEAEFKIEEGANQPFEGYGVFFAKGRWGRFPEVASKAITYKDGETWLALKCGDMVRGMYGTREHLLALNSNAHPVHASVLEDGTLTARCGAINSYHGVDHFSDKIYSLYIDFALKFGAKSIPSSDWEGTAFLTAHVPEKDAKRIAKKAPHILDVVLRFKAFGAKNEEVRNEIKRKLEENDIDFYGFYGDDRIIVHEYADITELVESQGTDDMVRSIKYASGEDDVETDYYFSECQTDDAEKVLDKLEPEKLKKLVQWLIEHYPDEYADAEFEHDDTDAIATFIKENDDDVWNALRHGYAEGRGRGAESGFYDGVRKAIEATGCIFFNSGKVSAEFQWDTACFIAPTIDEYLKDVSKIGFEDLSSHKWFKDKSGQNPLHFEEPSYGFYELDEETAVESFCSSHLLPEDLDLY